MLIIMSNAGKSKRIVKKIGYLNCINEIVILP